MMYTRTFWLQACHFNGQEEYDALVIANDTACSDADRFVALLRCARGAHGHNFKVVIEVEGSLDGHGFVVDDVVIERIVRRWDNTNLSLHADFEGKRATTENMAEILASMLSELVTSGKVRIYETENIWAQAEWVTS